VTSDDAMNQLLELIRREINGEITEADTANATKEILMRARLAMTDEEVLEIQRQALRIHHEVAKHISGSGFKVPGNDPHKPN